MSSNRSNGSGSANRRNFLKVAGGGIASTTLAGCLTGNGGGGGSGDIVIGGLQPYTGPYAETTQEFVSGLEFIIDDINSNGGVLDRELAFEDRDTELDPSEATSLATELIESENASVLTGPISSDIGLAVQPIAEENEVPHVPTLVGSHEFLTPDTRYNFRMGLAPAPTNARAVAQVIEQEGFETVGAIVADYSYGQAWQESMEAFFPDDLDLQIEVAPFGESSFTTYLRSLPSEMDLLISASHPPGVFTIYQQLMELSNVNATYVLGRNDAKLSIGALGDAITEGFLAQTHPNPFSDQYAEVGQRFYDQTGDFFGPLAAVGYVVGDLVSSAIENAGTAEPAEVATAMHEISLDTLFASPLQYTEWGELQDLVQILIEFEPGAPEYYPDGDTNVVEYFRTDPLPAYDPTSSVLSD